MTHFTRIICLASTIALAACGSSGSSSGGSITGTIHGQSFAIEDAISTSFTTTDSNGNTFSAAEIIMGDAKNLCTTFGANQQPKSLKGAVIGLLVVNGTTISAPTTPGTFTISSSPSGNAGVWDAIVTDASCMDVAASEAKGTSGTITLTSINNGAFDGHYDVVLDSGDHVTGSFSPESCPALATAINSTTPPSCI
jgi:hypothetical protein